MAQVMGKDSDQWQDVLYTDDPACAAHFVAVAVTSNPRVKAGRVVDTAQEQEKGGKER